MSTVEELEKTVRFDTGLAAFGVLVEALYERGGERWFSPSGSWRLARQNSDWDISQLIYNVFNGIQDVATGFFIDPEEITVEAVMNGSVRCHNLLSLAEAADCDPEFPRRLRYFRYDAEGIPVSSERWSWKDAFREEKHAAVSGMRRARPAEAIVAAAKMFRELRYLRINRASKITIPALARQNSVAAVFFFAMDDIAGDSATRIILRKIHHGHLAPGRYDTSHFGVNKENWMRTALLLGYVDMAGTMEHFDILEKQGGKK